MKTLRLLWLLAALGLIAGCAATRQNVSENGRPVRLQLTVGVPPSMSILYEEEVADAFAYRVSSILHEQGFRGRIHYVDRWSKPDAAIPVLAVELREWRVDRAGFVDCTFTANLQSPDGQKSLGLFTGTSLMTWRRRDWFSRAEGFDDAARDAITNLAARLEETGYLDRPPRR